MKKVQPKILVVDDDVGMRTTLEAIIEDEGYDVMVAGNGHDAVELTKRVKFDVIFLDIKLPGIDGVEVFRQVMKISPDTFVVLMTGFTVEDLISKARKEGAYSIMYKPLDIGRVVELIRCALESQVVLVVDDKADDRETLGAIIEGCGFGVFTADDGVDAVSMASERHYDVILMDLKMPGMDGLAAFQEIRKVDPLAKVIFVTGYSMEGPLREAVKSGTYTVLTKPVDPVEMLAAIHSVVG